MSIPHNQPEDEAMRRIKNEMANLKTQFADKISSIQENWSGNACEFSLSAMGFSGSGIMIVKQSEVEITGNLSFAAIFLKGKIESIIRDRLGKLLE
jgi:hypothetical protein